jgi:hypothetical protein
MILTISVVPAFGEMYAGDNLKPSILTDVERQKMDGDELPEEKIGAYSGDESKVANDSARLILEAFNINYDTIKSIELIQNNNIDKKVIRVELDAAQIDFDENGDIVNLLNYEDRSIVDQNRKDYKTNQTPSTTAPVLQYKSQESLNPIIEKMVSLNKLSGYELVSCDFNNYATWTLSWNKKLDNDIVNPYDVVVIMIDGTDGSVSIFARNSIVPNTTTPLVTKKDAIVSAKPVIEKLQKEAIADTDVTLAVFRPNFYWEDDGSYEPVEFIRLAWEIAGKDFLIYVDAETGEILGGDQYKAAGRALGPVTSFYMNTASVTLAANGLSTLGYSRPDPSVTWGISQGDINWVMNTAPYYGLYLSCHGSATTISDNQNWWFYASQLNANSLWYFVFLDACNTSSALTWPTKFGTFKVSSGTCFIGWNVNVPVTTAYEFATNFWPRVGHKAVVNAVLEARALTIQAGHTSSNCNPGFAGDVHYWGWSWS